MHPRPNNPHILQTTVWERAKGEKTCGCGNACYWGIVPRNSQPELRDRTSNFIVKKFPSPRGTRETYCRSCGRPKKGKEKIWSWETLIAWWWLTASQQLIKALLLCSTEQRIAYFVLATRFLQYESIKCFEKEICIFVFISSMCEKNDSKKKETKVLFYHKQSLFTAYWCIFQ